MEKGVNTDIAKPDRNNRRVMVFYKMSKKRAPLNDSILNILF